jgi:photosystem II stability/assembly factor-like uncharacterized protein
LAAPHVAQTLVSAAPRLISAFPALGVTPKEGRDESRPGRQECLRHEDRLASNSTTSGVRTLFALLLLALPLPAFAQYTLYACGSSTKDYVVGAKLPASGIFVRSSSAGWRHAGFNHPFISAFDFEPRDPSLVYAAAGNGLLRVTERGERWKILTGNDVTELLDVAVDRNQAGTVYFAHTAGIQASHDGGTTWADASTGLRRKYTAALRVDSRRAGVLLAGTEQGVYRSENGGERWKLAGAAGIQVLHIEQSPHDPCFWLASTEGGGLFASTDCGVTFESNGNLGVGRNIYDLAFDPSSPNRIAVAGWGVGVAVSEDRGKTWQVRDAGLPSANVWSVAFDPGQSGRLYTSVHQDAVYVSNDSGQTWRKDGLTGSSIFRMRFVPEVAK